MTITSQPHPGEQGRYPIVRCSHQWPGRYAVIVAHAPGGEPGRDVAVLPLPWFDTTARLMVSEWNRHAARYGTAAHHLDVVYGDGCRTRMPERPLTWPPARPPWPDLAGAPELHEEAEETQPDATILLLASALYAKAGAPVTDPVSGHAEEHGQQDDPAGPEPEGGEAA